MADYQLTSVLTRGNADVLAIHCGDYRFQSAFREFLAQRLNLEGKYDLMALPGGPLSLTLAEYLPEFSRSSWKWLRFFVEHHEVRRLILIQHQDCGFYKTMPHHLHSSSDPRQRQEQDLRRVNEAIAKQLPQVSAELYYAAWDPSDRIVMQSVSS